MTEYKASVSVNKIVGDHILFKVSIPAESIDGNDGAIHTYYIKKPMGDDPDDPEKLADQIQKDVQDALQEFHRKLEAGVGRDEALQELLGTAEAPKLMPNKEDAEKLISKLSSQTIGTSSPVGAEQPTKTKPSISKEEIYDINRIASSTKGQEALTHIQFDTLRPKDITRAAAIGVGIMGFAKNIAREMTEFYPEQEAKSILEAATKLTEENIQEQLPNVVVNDGLVEWVSNKLNINIDQLNEESGRTLAAVTLLASATLKATNVLRGRI